MMSLRWMFMVTGLISLILSQLYSVSLAQSAPTDEPTDSQVLVVTGETIEQAVLDNPFLVVEFYAPWCGHCKNLAPIYTEAAAKIKETDDGIVLAKMDATEEISIAFRNKVGVGSFPTFKIFKGDVNEPVEVRPPRYVDGLTKYFIDIKNGGEIPVVEAAKKAREAEEIPEPENSEVTVLNSDTFSAFIRSNPFVAVEFYAPWCNFCKDLAPEWTKASITLKESEPTIKMAKIDVDAPANEELGEDLSINLFPTIRVFRGEDDMKEYDGPRSAGGIVEYLTDVLHGKIVLEEPSDDDDDDWGDDDDDVEVVTTVVTEGTPEPAKGDDDDDDEDLMTKAEL